MTAIDVGSAKTCVLVAEITENGLRYRGHGLSESRGSRKGIIVDLDKAVASIQKAAERAEDVANIAYRARHPRRRRLARARDQHSRRSGFQPRSREIGRDEIRQAVEKARNIPLPPDREVLHLLPQEFILDDQSGVHDPLGMIATRLEVRVHMITAATSATQNVVTAVNRAGVHVDDTVFEPLACADSVLRSDERELGICLADIGAGSTNVIVIQEGAVAHSAVLPVGGDHFTSDLSVGLCTPIIEAEKIKKAFGNTVVTLIPEGNEVEVPSVGDRPSRLVSQRMVGEILEPRARELFEMLRENLRHSGMLEVCAAGLVLSGGGARLPGIMDVADSVIRKPIRMAWPVPHFEDAIVAGRTGVCNRAGHGRLQSPRPQRSRHSGRSLEFATKSDAGGKGSVRVVHPETRGTRSQFRDTVSLCPGGERSDVPPDARRGTLDDQRCPIYFEVM